MVIVREFSGGIDMDAHPSRVRSIDYADALNITHNSKNKAGVVFHIQGNRIVNFTMPAGTNVCIGAYPDSLRNRVIFFNWNSNGNHFVGKFDNATRTISKIIESKTHSNDIDIFTWSRNAKINDIDIIHRSSVDGDLLFFNDGVNNPFGFNIDTISDYFAGGVADYMVRVAKKPPLNILLPQYQSDSNVKTNLLHKKLFQFKFRWVYKDGYKSTWSGWSKVVLPVSGYSIITDTDPTQNNYMLLQVQAGDADAQKIEIAMRESNGASYGDAWLVDSLDVTDYNIPAAGTYDYRFYNDGAYTLIDPEDSDLLYSRFPHTANAQAVANGKYLVYGGITEGYDPIPRADINVQMSYVMVDTSPNEIPTGPPSLSYSISSSPSGAPTDHILYVYVGVYVSGGSIYHVQFIADSGQTLNVEYTADNDDTRTDVRDALISLVDAALGPNYTVVATDGLSGFTFKIETNTITVGPPQFFTYVNIFALQAQTAQGSTATWKWNSRYRFGLVYYDKYGRTNGVISYVSSTDDVSDFAVTTPDFLVNASNSFAPRVPIITASIGHIPPVWATSMQWVRTPNLTVSKFLQYATCKIDVDDDYVYFCIENLDQFRINNTGFVPSYDFLKGDRIRVMCTIDNNDEGSAYTVSYHSDEYEIIGVVTREVTPAVDDVEAVMGRFIKVNRPSLTTTYNPFQLVEIFTPALRSRDDEQFFFEFGEYYPIVGGYHTGNVRSQTASLSAQYEFYDGDTYFKIRKMYNDTFSEGLGFMLLGLMDANYADYWQSQVTSNGRPLLIDVNAKRTYKPAMARFSQAFEEGTTINGLNTFYPLNYEECKRKYGSIQKMIDWNNELVVAQELKIGKFPVFQTVIQYVNGQDTIESSRLLNKIQYYDGEFGVGAYKDSISWGQSMIWFWDSVRNANCRLSQSGLDEISKQKNVNAFAVQNCTARKIYGVYDTENDLYMSFFESTLTAASTSIVWNERRKNYESRLGYAPEMICCLDGLVMSWKNGALWTHDADTVNTFYGEEIQESLIIPVFNDQASMKKSFDNMTQLAGEAWEVPTMETNVYSYLRQVQATSIKDGVFSYSEGEYHAAIPKDVNSPGGKINGAGMKGQWLKATIKKAVPTIYSYLNAVLVSDIPSPKNPS